MADESRELFYLDQEGKPRDAELHDDILRNRRADLWGRIESFMDAVLDDGADPREAQETFALTDKDIESELYQEVMDARHDDGERSYRPRRKE
jgi:hypothetical protein